MKHNKTNLTGERFNELKEVVNLYDWMQLTEDYITVDRMKHLYKVIEELREYGCCASKWLAIAERIVATNDNIRYVIQSVTKKVGDRYGLVSDFKEITLLVSNSNDAMRFKGRHDAERAIRKIIKKEGYVLGATATLYRAIRVQV